MKKSIGIIVVLLVFAGAALPYVNGLILEKAVSRIQANVNQTYADSGSDVRLEIQSYDRGVSESVFEWKIDFGLLSNLYGIDEIVFVETAKHGYGQVVSHTSLEKNDWFSAFVTRRLDGKNPLHIQTTYSLNGDIVSTLELDACSLKDNDMKIDIGPVKMSFSTDQEFKKIQSDLVWTGCDIPGKFKLDSLSMTSQMTRMSTYIWDGSFNGELLSLAVQEGPDRFEIKQVNMDNILDYNKETGQISLGMGMNIEKIKEQDKAVLHDGSIRLELNRIDAAGYEQVAGMYTAMVNDIMKIMGEKGFDPGRMEAVFKREMAGRGMQIMAEAEKLLKKDLEIRVVDLKAGLPQGEISGDLSFGLKKDLTLAGLVPLMMQPSLALDIFSLQTRLSFPAVLAGNRPDLVEPVYPGMQTGLFVKKGQMLTHAASIQDGKLILNNMEVRLR